jgi:mRNA interferase MazF
MFQPDLLSSRDVILVALPGHIPRRHEQQGNRPVIVIGLPWGEVRYPMLIVVPLTTQTGLWSRQNPSLYPCLEAGVGGLPQPSIVLLDQLRSIDPRRVLAYLGTLTPEQYIPIQSGLMQLCSQANPN